jgi:hypothetical protein
MRTFTVPHAGKVKAGKSRPVATDTARKSQPGNYRYGRKFPASNHRYGQKIPASNTIMAGKSRPLTTDMAGKFKFRLLTKRMPQRLLTQGISVALVEYLLGNLKVKVHTRPVYKSFYFTPSENSSEVENSAENSGPLDFFALRRVLVCVTRSGLRKLTSQCSNLSTIPPPQDAFHRVYKLCK